MITVGMLAKIRRMYFRDKLSIREISRRTNMSRNTISDWLKKEVMSEPKYPQRQVTCLIDPYADQLRQWLETDRHRPKRNRRTAKVMFEALKGQGFSGSYVRVAGRVRQLRQAVALIPAQFFQVFVVPTDYR